MLQEQRWKNAPFFSLLPSCVGHGRSQIWCESFTKSVSILFHLSCFLQFVQWHRGKNWSGACADIIKRTCHSQADLYGSNETQTYNSQTAQTYLQLTNTCLLHHAIHVGVAVLPGGSRLWHLFYKQSWTACGCRCLGNQHGEALIRAAKQSGWFSGSFADMGYMISR